MSPDPKWQDRGDLRLLNTGYRRVDGPDKVTGRARYAHDVRLPNQVYARLILHTFPRAVIESMDLEPARRIPGVVLVEGHRSVGDDLAYLGGDSVVAYVAAETPEAARDAARAVRVAFRDQYPAMVTREQSLAPGAPEITRRGNVSGARDRGDEEAVEAALEGAAAVVDQVYELPIQHHVCLETHGHVVDYDGESATCYASTQMVSGSVDQFARELDLPADKVRVLTPVMGGGFGSKFGIGLEGAIACAIAKRLKRPVHLLLDRPQEFQMAGNRSGTWVRMRGGVDAEGRLVGQFAEIDRLGGIGNGSFPTPPYIYACEPNAARARSVHTALDANRAMRAPGHPQASFAQESLVDELAYAAGLDPLEVRKLNVESDVYRRQLDAVAEAIGWAEHPHRSAPGAAGPDGWAEGIGFGIATWGAGGQPGCEVEVRVMPDGAVTSSCAVQDLGTGSRTLVAAIVAEELGLPLSAVAARVGDSDLPPSVGSGGSVTTGALAPAVKVAAHRAREALEAKLEPVLGAAVGEYEWADGLVRVGAEPDRALSFGEVCALLGSQPLSVRGAYDGSLDADGSLHGAQAARVRVDTLTGRVKVVEMVAMHDQGIPFNRLALTSQINGGLIQALSYGLLEERIVDPGTGHLLTDNLESYKIAGSKEMPALRVIIDEDDERNLATGMAEAPVIPGHSAIANAIFNACGARLRGLPFTPDRVLAALAERA